MNTIYGIKAITFVGDGTLWDFEKVMVHSLDHVLRELERKDPKSAELLSIGKMIQIRNEVARKYKGRVINLEEIRLIAFQRTLKDLSKMAETL